MDCPLLNLLKTQTHSLNYSHLCLWIPSYPFWSSLFFCFGEKKTFRHIRAIITHHPTQSHSLLTLTTPFLHLTPPPSLTPTTLILTLFTLNLLLINHLRLPPQFIHNLLRRNHLQSLAPRRYLPILISPISHFLSHLTHPHLFDYQRSDPTVSNLLSFSSASSSSWNLLLWEFYQITQEYLQIVLKIIHLEF